MSAVRKIFKVSGIILGVIILLLLCGLVYSSIRWDAAVERSVREFKAPQDSATLARGEFLFVKSLNCLSCHAGEGQSNTAAAGGMKFDLTTLSPSLGVYYARNITPDVETGIGGWTDGEIVRSIREGVRKDGRVLFPIMPVDPLNGLSDDDVLALVAYLRTLPPVKNHVPERVPSLFAKTLLSLGVIGPMKQQTEPIIAPQRAITPEYGKYVAKHASLCSDCHTPRNLMNGEFYYDSLLAGGSIHFGEGEDVPVRSFASNITPDSSTGIGRWTEEQFLDMMRTGMGPDGKVRTRHMPYAFFGLWDSLELRAVYSFIRSIPPVLRSVAKSEFVGDAIAADQQVKGKGVFNSYCVPCHGTEGKGALPTNVLLAEVAPTLTDAELKEFIMVGNSGLRMPGFVKTLTEKELDAVVTYVRSWKAQPTLATGRE